MESTPATFGGRRRRWSTPVLVVADDGTDAAGHPNSPLLLIGFAGDRADGDAAIAMPLLSSSPSCNAGLAKDGDGRWVATDGDDEARCGSEHYGLPLLPPYMGGENANRGGGGVNFAVIGATALSDDVLEAKWSYSRDNISMMAQINMFKTYLPSICKTSSCHEILDKSLIVFGSFGSNDYASTVLMKKVEDAYRLQPLVINAVGSAIEELIKLGVVNLVVPGMLPAGCLGDCLAVYYNSNEEDYDPITGCLTWLNEFTQKHNELLQKELTRIQEHYPNVFITYADYYNADYNFLSLPTNMCPIVRNFASRLFLRGVRLFEARRRDRLPTSDVREATATESVRRASMREATARVRTCEEGQEADCRERLAAGVVAVLAE
nr:sinapine esterase-like [Ipomoea batatas]